MTTGQTAQRRRGPGRPPADAPLPDLEEILQRGLEAFAELGYEDRLVHEGTLRDIPWYLFHFAITKPLAMYSQAPLARLFGRPDDADDHTLMSTLVLNGLLM
jgi:hypothetical protein